MQREISHVSYHPFSCEELKFCPREVRVDQPDVEMQIKGTVCGGYSNIKCKTCNRLDPQCTGHWMKLLTPGIRLYIKSYDYILMKLNEYICFQHRGLICEPTDSLTEKELSSAKKSGMCQVCYNPLVKYTVSKKDEAIRYVVVNEYREVYVDPVILYECIDNIPHRIQRMITDQPIKLQRFFYVDELPIIPTYLRTSNKFDRVNEYAHYLTNKYLEIVGFLRDYYKPDVPDHIKKLIIVRTQIKMNEIIDGKESVDPKFDSCSGYLKTKYNLFREYINGKRNPKTARVVLNTNMLPSLNYFYPCVQYIENITTTIPYCQYTSSLIEDLINKGVAKQYFSNTKKSLCDVSAIQGLTYGDYFEVAFSYGDGLVMSGRQPALHITNIFTGKAITTKRPYINSQSTQLPTAVLPGMNGDQDGDEVWSKEVQSVLAKYEQRYLMLPSCNMISPAHGGINYGIIQDELLSINTLLAKNVTFYQAVLLLGKNMEYLPTKDTKKVFTGREIISALIPTFFNKSGIVKDGIIQHSRLKSADLGVGGGTVHSITKSLLDIDPVRAKMFLESILKISKSFISLFPHGVRVKDILSDMDIWEEINVVKEAMYQQIEKNRQKYLHAVARKKIVPMDTDYEYKFIKLEVAKVVTEITKRARKIIDGYIEDYKAGREFNRLVLYILAEFKLDLATLSIIYCQANPSIEPKSNYLHRTFPCFPAKDKSIGNLGLVKSSLIKGLTLPEMITQADKARENVVTTVCQTASKGEIGRYIIKNLENYTICFGARFLVLGQYLMSPCLNVYKMPVRQLYLVSLDIPLIRQCKLENDILSKRIVELYKLQAPYLYDYKTKKYETQVAYLTDIQLMFESYRKEDMMLPDQIVARVEDFFDHIYDIYMLSLSTTSMLKLITLLYSKKYKVTTDGMNMLLAKIELKYKLYPEVGAPIGIEAGTSISEVETQSTLSAHLQFTKNGCDVKSTQSSTNINLMKINVTKLNNQNSKIYNLTSSSLEALEIIRHGLEYISLEDIMLSIFFDGPEVTIKISRSNMKRLSLPRFFLDMMIENFCSSCSFIEEVLVLTEEDDDVITMKLNMILVSDSFLPVLRIIIKQGISKGTFSLYRAVIEKCEIMNPETLEDEEKWNMICEITNLSYLSFFDTTDIQVTPSLEITNKIGPIQAYNALASQYIGSGLLRCHTHLLSQHQARFDRIRRVEKNPDDEMTTISRIAFIKPLKDLQDAVKQSKIEKVDDNSSRILLGMPIKMGTGAFDIGVDIRPYLNNNKEQCSIQTLTL